MKKLMKAVAVCICMMFSVSAQAAVKKPNVVGGGVVLASPESFGFYATYFPDTELSIDAWGTLTTLDAGLTGHKIMFEGDTGLHSLIFTGMGGYVHEMVASNTFNQGSYHFVLAGGYGFRSHGGWDMRVQLGVVMAENDLGQADSGFHTHFMLGHSF